MALTELTLAVDLPWPQAVVWDWTTDLRNVNAICNPFFGFRYDLSSPPWLGPNLLIPTQSLMLGLPLGFTELRITAWQTHQLFVDEGWRDGQRLWRHTHFYEPLGQQTRYTDRIHIEVGPLGAAGRAIVALFFRYRHHNLRRMLRPQF